MKCCRVADRPLLAVLLAAAVVCGAATTTSPSNSKLSATPPGVQLVAVLIIDEQLRAVVTADGAQEEITVGEGDMIEGYTVRRIEQDQIELVRGGRSETILMKNIGRLKPKEGLKTYTAAYGGRAASSVKRIASSMRLKHFLTARRSRVPFSLADGRPDFVRPIYVGYVSSPFGVRRGSRGGGGRYHNGVDVAAPHGSPVYAAADGVVVTAEWSWAKGNFIEVRHGSGYTSCYFHLSARLVEVGRPVKSGEMIGRVGSTGLSSGPHLHFEIRLNGAPMDPALYIRSLNKR